MPLPTSREETATPANPVSSNTINAIQDSIVGAKFPLRTVWTPPRNLYLAGGVAPSNAAQVLTSTGAADVWCDALPLPPGTRITHIKARTFGTGASNISCVLYATKGDVAISIGSVSMIATPAAWATYTHEILSAVFPFPALPHIVLDEYAYHWNINFGAVGQKVASLGIVHDRL
jgi:hypothetical protein